MDKLSSSLLRQTLQNLRLWCVCSDQQCATGFCNTRNNFFHNQHYNSVLCLWILVWFSVCYAILYSPCITLFYTLLISNLNTHTIGMFRVIQSSSWLIKTISDFISMYFHQYYSITNPWLTTMFIFNTFLKIQLAYLNYKTKLHLLKLLS